jgi:hypothetical protein
MVTHLHSITLVIACPLETGCDALITMPTRIAICIIASTVAWFIPVNIPDDVSGEIGTIRQQCL